MGGLHHIIIATRAQIIGYTSFSFPSLADYEIYRNKIQNTPRCLEAFKVCQRYQMHHQLRTKFSKTSLRGVTDKAKCLLTMFFVKLLQPLKLNHKENAKIHH
jgi:hypothetical protein